MVVMFFPPACDTGVEHERIAAPSRCTVQAPHSPAPHPNLVPVSAKVSRKTQSNGVSGGTLSFLSVPLTRIVMSAIFLPLPMLPGDHPTQPAAKVKWFEMRNR